MSVDASYVRRFCIFSESYLISFESELLSKYLREKLGISYDCYVAKATKKCGAAKSLGSDI